MNSNLQLAICFLSLSLLTPACSREAAAPAEEVSDQPNFVFILADDLGWNDVGYHGSEIQTPQLDRLAREGVRMEQHYVHPVCSPTRAALLTGRTASRFGILGAIGGNSRQLLPLEAKTLPSVLSDHGYRTHITGKWHLALTPEFGPTRYGFQTSYGYLHGQIDPYTHLYKFGDRTWHRNDQLIEEEGHVTDLITQDAVSFIRSAGDEPFFLYVAFSVPHYPLAEPDEWVAPYQSSIPERSRRLFAASTSHMDHGIGQIVQALADRGLAESTLVVFSSDNGGQESWMDTEGQYDGRYPPDPVLGDNTPLRGWKGQVYEGGVRVPAIAYWPGKLDPTAYDDPAFIGDWFPTFAGLAGAAVDLPSGLDGVDLWARLSQTIPIQDRNPIYIKAASGRMLRDGSWKLIESRDQQLSLFNLEDDPYEERDLALESPEKLNQLRRMLENAAALDQEPTYWGNE